MNIITNKLQQIIVLFVYFDLIILFAKLFIFLSIILQKKKETHTSNKILLTNIFVLNHFVFLFKSSPLSYLKYDTPRILLEKLIDFF